MTFSQLKDQLGLVEAKLFASAELVVIQAIDTSDDRPDAVDRLQQFGMSAAQADVVLDLPLCTRTRAERNALFVEAERLRRLL